MSENPNPTRCGNCGTMNPPGQEFCINCHAPLTRAAEGDALAGTPEAVDEPRRLEVPAEDGTTMADPTGGGPLPTEGIPPEADDEPL